MARAWRRPPARRGWGPELEPAPGQRRDVAPGQRRGVAPGRPAAVAPRESGGTPGPSGPDVERAAVLAGSGRGARTRGVPQAAGPPSPAVLGERGAILGASARLSALQGGE